MPDMTESMSEIDARAQELVLFELSGKPSGHVHYARTPQQPAADEAVRIAVHERAAELYAELIAAAPGIWNERNQLIADRLIAAHGRTAHFYELLLKGVRNGLLEQLEREATR